MHLRTTDALGDFCLCHILEKAQCQDHSLALGQGGDQRPHGLNVEHLFEIVIIRAESFSESLLFVVQPERRVG